MSWTPRTSSKKFEKKIMIDLSYLTQLFRIEVPGEQNFFFIHPCVPVFKIVFFWPRGLPKKALRGPFIRLAGGGEQRSLEE